LTETTKGNEKGGRHDADDGGAKNVDARRPWWKSGNTGAHRLLVEGKLEMRAGVVAAKHHRWGVVVDREGIANDTIHRNVNLNASYATREDPAVC
jgi:hypothetical protein